METEVHLQQVHGHVVECVVTSKVVVIWEVWLSGRCV